MEYRTNFRKSIIFLLCFWIIGIALFIWFGLGWFFLLITVRQILFFIPQTSLIIQKLFHLNNNVTQWSQNQERNCKTSVILRLLIILIWLSLTIFVFMKLNIKLLSIL